MPKTRKQRSLSSLSSLKGKQEHVISIHDLQCWYTHEFEKLGWMILAHEHGESDKLHCYKQGLDHLKDHIERRMKKCVDRESKMDLGIMYDNVSVLIRHVGKDTH